MNCRFAGITAFAGCLIVLAGCSSGHHAAAPAPTTAKPSTGATSSATPSPTPTAAAYRGPALPVGALVVSVRKAGHGEGSVQVFSASSGKLLGKAPVGIDPGVAAVATAGMPEAGAIFTPNYGVDGQGTTVTVSTMTGRTLGVVSMLGYGEFDAGIAPAHTPKAGWVYVVQDGTNNVGVISPSGEAGDPIPVGQDPARLTFVPAGLPHAGDVLVANQSTPVLTRITPAGLVKNIPIDRGASLVAVAPAGLPNAGRIYLGHTGTGGNSPADSLTVLDPTGRKIGQIPVGRVPQAIAIAGPGTPAAGSLYVTNERDGTITVIGPDGTVRRTVSLGTAVLDAAVAPAGTPAAGELFVCDYGTSFTKGPDTIDVFSPSGDLLRRIPVSGQPAGLAIVGP